MNVKKTLVLKDKCEDGLSSFLRDRVLQKQTDKANRQTETCPVTFKASCLYLSFNCCSESEGSAPNTAYRSLGGDCSDIPAERFNDIKLY